MEQKTVLAPKSLARTSGGMWSQAAGREKEAVRLCKVVLVEVQCLPSYFCGHLMKREGLEGGLSLG